MKYKESKIETIKVQCISTKCGLYTQLKLGKWYDAVEYYKGDFYCIIQLGYGSYDSLYEKSLFRTLDKRRDHRLNKILNK